MPCSSSARLFPSPHVHVPSCFDAWSEPSHPSSTSQIHGPSPSFHSETVCESDSTLQSRRLYDRLLPPTPVKDPSNPESGITTEWVLVSFPADSLIAFDSAATLVDLFPLVNSGQTVNILTSKTAWTHTGSPSKMLTHFYRILPSVTMDFSASGLVRKFPF